MERDEVSTHVPSDFHPLHAKSNSGKAALDNIYRVWHTLGQQDVEIGKTKDGVLADKVVQFAMPVMDKLVASVGGDIDALNNEISAAEVALRSALAVKPEHREYGAELRAALRAEKHTASAIVNAARAGDLVTVAAAMAAPRFLLGMDDSTYEKTLALCEGIIAPELVKQRDLLRKERDLVTRAKDRLEQYFMERLRKWSPTPKAFAPLQDFKLNQGPRA